VIEESRPILRRRPVLHVRVFEDGVQRASTLVLAQHVLHEVRLTPRDEQQRERVFASGPPSHADPLRFLRRFGRGARRAPRPSFSRRGTPCPFASGATAWSSDPLCPPSFRGTAARAIGSRPDTGRYVAPRSMDVGSRRCVGFVA